MGRQISVGFLAVIWLCAALASAALAAGEPDAYTLGPEDHLYVSVLKQSELSRGVEVPPGGIIVLPVVGELSVVGKTRAQVAAEIADRLARTGRYVEPEVTVELTQPRPRRVFVVGNALGSQMVLTRPGWRVADVLAAAGGLNTLPHFCHAQLVRRDGSIVPIDLPKLLTSPATEANPEVQADDLLRIDRTDTGGVYIAGEVIFPGPRVFVVGQGAATAIGWAGGPTPKADLRRVLIAHNDRSVEVVDLYDAIVNRDITKDMPLRPGDVILLLPSGQAEQPLKPPRAGAKS
jgi:polysaccharide export outer membrane protein